MVTFPAGLPRSFHAAWLACHELAIHLPGPQDLDGPRWPDAVVRFCVWAREGALAAAEDAVQKVAGNLGETSLALTLVAASRRLFETCSPAAPTSPRGKVWDMRRFEPRRTLRPIELPLPVQEYEAAVRDQITRRGGQDCLDPLRGLTPEGLLGAIEDEFCQAALSKPQGAAAIPESVPEQGSPVSDPVMAAPVPVASEVGGAEDRLPMNVVPSPSDNQGSEERPSLGPNPEHDRSKEYRIPPEYRTRPMSLQEAARFMGYEKSRGRKLLRSAIKSGKVECEQLSRQQFIFDRRMFPKEAWRKVIP
jgi:hypothetical protein